MALSERDRRAIVLGAGALVVIAVCLGIDRLWAWHEDLTSRHSEGAQRLARILMNESKADYWAEQVADWEEKVGELTSPAEYNEQITVMTENIMNAAGKSGIELKGSTPSAAIAWPDDPELRQATFVIDAETKWENTFNFINALYAIENVVSVENMDLSGDPKKGDKMALKLTVSVLVKAPQEGSSPW